ncbi:hypothetical protein MICAE_1910001 [Microcystis aeruginosa PCC 9806]|uniref:Uncharacterized protein n=1 Tax=Microcystis aeruginosa PCC 9806 TaxID=1160282 RepID=I4GUL1_MICAE|nr:hypothetical protein MICAE_1910001 [Microcystis aeruginosa PCC 9806]
MDSLTTRWGRFVEELVEPAVIGLFRSKGVDVKETWLSWIWWAKCILRYIPPSEGVEQTTKTQRTQRSILCKLS